MPETDWDELGRLADSIANMRAALKIPGIPDRLHVQAFREALPEWIATLRRAYVTATGDNPWEDEPCSAPKP